MHDWDAAYRRGETPWELSQSPPPLVDLLLAHRDRLGRALVPGCGRAEDALYAASLGATVTGWDIAPTAIAAARERAVTRGLAVEFAVCDALHPASAAAGAFDTWIEHRFFTALPPALRPQYFEAAATLLRPCGLILGVFLVGEEEGGPPFAVGEAQLRSLIAPAFRVVTLARAENSIGMGVGRELVAALERRASAEERQSSLQGCPGGADEDASNEQ